MSRKPTKVSVFGIQRKIVANMTVEGWQDAPHCSYTFEPDLTEFYKKYEAFAEGLKKDGKRITFNTVMMKAICEALKSAPEMNAHIKFNRKLVRGEVTTFDQIDVSMPCILPDGSKIEIEETCEGKIGYEFIGDGGFGYDPIFYFGDKTFAQISGEDKDKVSHRGKALRKLQAALREHFG